MTHIEETAPTVLALISGATASSKSAAISAMSASAKYAGVGVIQVAGPGLREATEGIAAVLTEVKRRASHPDETPPPIFLAVDVDQLLVRKPLPSEYPPGHPAVVHWRAVAKAQEALRSSIAYIAREGPSVCISIAVARNPAASEMPAAVTSTNRSRSPD